MAKEFPRLETERLILRALEKSDTLDFLKIRSNAEVLKSTAIKPYKPDDIVRADRFIRQAMNKFQRGTFTCWGIVISMTDKLIGIIMNEDFNKHSNRVEIAYFSKKSAWGKGYTTEALAAVVDYNFDVLHVNRQQAWVFPENIASSRVLEKNSFTYEGTLRQYMQHPDGTLRDVMMYSLLRSDLV